MRHPLRPPAKVLPMRGELPYVAGWARGLLRCDRHPVSDAAAPSVLLVPGLLSGDASLRTLADALERAGHAPAFARIGLNVDCSQAAVEQLTARVEAAVAARGEPVALVGHSRGGLLARVVAVRRPQLVSQLVTLGTPHRDQLAIHPLVWAGAWALAALSAAGVGGLMSAGCGHGACCAAFRRDLAAALEPGLPFVSIFSPRDGIVDPAACLDPGALHVEVAVAHLHLTTAPAALAAVCSALEPRRHLRAVPACAPQRHPGTLASAA